MSKEELNLDYQKAYDVWKSTMREGNYLLAVKSAFEKQIPKKPILDCIFPSGIKWYLCPACNHNGIEKVGGYCHSCGQALDWGDTE